MNFFNWLDNGCWLRYVERMINIDVGGDLVGGSIGDYFNVFCEFLGMLLVGCCKVFFMDIVWSNLCVYSFYFRLVNVDVNCGIFVVFINLI